MQLQRSHAGASLQQELVRGGQDQSARSQVFRHAFFEQLDARLKAKQATGDPVLEEEYQRLYELDVKRRQLTERVETEDRESTAGLKSEQPKRRLLRTEVTEDEIAEIVSALDRAGGELGR